MMASSRNHFAYLLRMIRENQKKTLSEWNALIRSALVEIDEEIEDTSVSERSTVLTFEDYRTRLQKMSEDKGFATTENVGKTRRTKS